MGDPVAGNPTQYMLEKAFAAARLDWRFLTFEVPPLEFEGALRGARIFDFQGIMLSTPHRARVLPYLEHVDDAARISGQVNCIKQIDGQLHGFNTEGRAMRQLLEQAGAVKNAKVTILGAGRLASAIAAELSLVGVHEIIFACREPEEAEPLVKSLRERTPLNHCRIEKLDDEKPLAIDEDCRALINATSVDGNTADEQLAVETDTLSRKTLVADVVYYPPETWLLRRAEDRDCSTLDGLTLLIEHAALAFEIWTEASADRQAMREAVEEFLVL